MLLKNVFAQAHTSCRQKNLGLGLSIIHKRFSGVKIMPVFLKINNPKPEEHEVQLYEALR